MTRPSSSTKIKSAERMELIRWATMTEVTCPQPSRMFRRTAASVR